MSPLTFAIPKAKAEKPNERSDDLFPEGLWRGTIENVYVNEVEPGDRGEFLLDVGSRKEPLRASSARVASVQLGSIEALGADQPEVGARKFFDERIYLEIDGVEWTSASEEQLEKYWKLRQTQNRLTNLALAIPGAYEEVGDNVRPTESFVEAFEQTLTDPETGEQLGLAGASVFFSVAHRGGTFTDDETGEEVTWEKHYLENYQQAV